MHPFFSCARTRACRVHTRVNARVVPAIPRHARLPALLFAFCLTASAEPADWIYTARYVVTMDAQHRLISDGAVAIRGERIVGVGKRADIEKQFQPRQRLDRPEALI